VASLFEYLQDVLLSVFVRDPQALERRRQLRSLQHKIQRAHPQYYRRASGQLLPAFGVAVAQLSAVLGPLREILDKTLSHPDSRLAQRYADYMLVSRLPEPLQGAYSLLGFSALKQRVLSAPEPAAELAAAEGEVQRLLDHLKGPELQDFERDYPATQRLVSLCQHDLSRLLALFGPRAGAEADEAAGYQPASGGEALPELLDLYFVLAGLQLSPGVERNLDSLLQRLTHGAAEEARSRLQRIFQKLRGLLEEKLQPGTLLLLVRLMQKDPHYVPQSMRDEAPAIEGFRNRWLMGFQRARDHIQWLLREHEVAEDLKGLFGEAELLEIEGYQEAVDQALQQHELIGFAHIRPLRSMKSYALMNFERGGLREIVKRLIVEGKFENRIFQNMLTNTFFGCEGVADRIREFEQTLQSDGPQSARRLPRYLELLAQDKPVMSILSAVLEGIQSTSAKLVEEGTNLFSNLCVVLLEVLNDAKQKNPALISNIKSLGGRRSQEQLARLAGGYNTLLLFTRIMRNFTHVRQADASTAAPATY